VEHSEHVCVCTSLFCVELLRVSFTESDSLRGTVEASDVRINGLRLL